jgi:hypothetical protein
MVNLLHYFGFTRFADAVADNRASAFDVDSVCPDVFSAPGAYGFKYTDYLLKLKEPLRL